MLDNFLKWKENGRKQQQCMAGMTLCIPITEEGVQMIRNTRRLSDFEINELKKEKLSYAEALKIFEGMWKEGVSLNVLPPKDPLEGIEADTHLAKVLNSCLKNS
jgi:hypothetical protein